ncbi:MAG: guanylate kinase [Nitratiruptor sp.]|nr:guanylate kinase [Nitratiruptor sp.]NPA83053.1 guanylate kinase [Campylobacterota bacterium]
MRLKRGACLLLSGPSGSGKSTLIRELLQHDPNIYFSISTTTRGKRPGEQEGRDYFFVTKEQFEEAIAAGAFLEWAKVHEHYYGTALAPVMEAIEAGKLVLFDVDVQGFEAIMKSQLAEITTSVFITTPTLSELRRRLEARGSDDPATIERRLQNAKEEIVYMPRYDYVLINDDLAKSRKKIFALAEVARLKHSRQELEAFVELWVRS